jgi:hypothetical protein
MLRFISTFFLQSYWHTYLCTVLVLNELGAIHVLSEKKIGHQHDTFVTQFLEPGFLKTHMDHEKDIVNTFSLI